MLTKQDIKEAVAARDYGALRRLAESEAAGGPAGKALSERLYVAAAIVEVAQRADGLECDGPHREPQQAIDACASAIGVMWPTRKAEWPVTTCIMTEWVLCALTRPADPAVTR